MKRVLYLVGWTGDIADTDTNPLDYQESAVELADMMQQGADDRGQEIRYHVLRQTGSHLEIVHQC